MKFIAAGTFFLPLALASKGVFDGVDPLCRPCLNEAIADGPGNTQSKKFANYLCMGQGASAVSLCITECGTSTSGDINDISAAEARVDLIMGIVFGYCVQYYPEQTCAAFEGTDLAQLPPCPEIRNGEKNGGNDSPRSSSETSTTEAPASETTEDPAPDATETTGYSHVTYSASGSDSTGASPQPTSSPGSGSSGSGSSHTSAGGIPAAMGAFASWEMLIGLVMLAVNI
ncbi:hypothetical protein NOF04DRAFT_6326 [Fusarium oxysporum II5]|uniref:Extracellular membrane protein CFEM domain-containing protein n=3 Tax=Fusarium oxysporum species complex TaxID=171631 RepID=N1R9P6_FUSC4|nr:uncharacterized protein FOIG_09498 [Fusarium odoratissimum NRRL 54006]EMT63013.1 hypothetical protein FOC4_g10013208 [Fusarium odoratissimum]EXL98774.1 hypothetical protein FOIG_09498 [Fusarium odoratissimum NRRL 54006]KAK2129194.1 hypothetical protein NOF04DRAFT_6326 [Fusarium oxysporum II5]TXC01637.1 hypothetical protein FocTR4_00008006 [Fusarium oxysporum f. sp. cubense]